jgi:signal transduction histidine kinase
MSESYSEREATAAAARVAATVAEPATGGGAGLARALFAMLLPDVDVELLVAGLLAEREGGAEVTATQAARSDGELSPPMRELRRVRTQLALGMGARTLQHSINNPLTALLAEAQLLEMEPLTEEQRAAVGRMVELSRRMVALTRRLDVTATGELDGGFGR